MFQTFNVNFEKIGKKENSSKFITMGAILIVLGILSLFYKGLGIKIVSWTLAIALSFIAYLNLKNLNELKRYAPKNEIAPYSKMQFILLISIVLLFLFPEKIQGIVSSLFGFYLVISQIIRFFKSRNNPYYKLSFWNVFELAFGLILIMSPFVLSKFIASILSFIIILIGIYLFSTGNKLKNI